MSRGAFSQTIFTPVLIFGMFVDSRVWHAVDDVESVFEFVDELGTGSMAQVFSAVDRKSRAPVALKVVPRSALEDAEVLDSLSVEVELLRALRHPGIVAIQEPPVVCDAQSVQDFFSQVESESLLSCLVPVGTPVASTDLPSEPDCRSSLRILSKVSALCSISSQNHS